MAGKTMSDKKSEHDAGWQTPRERAPSAMMADEPTWARTIGFFGILCMAVGAMGLMFYATGRRGLIGPGMSGFVAFLGMACLLFHASRDTDIQIRRIYGMFGFLCVLMAVLLAILHGRAAVLENAFLQYSIPFFLLGLLFLLVFAHNETDEQWRNRAEVVLGGGGAIMALTGSVGSVFWFDSPHGYLLAVVGLGYLWAFVGLRGADSELGYRAALGIGGVGIILLLVAIVRSLFFAGRVPFVPGGLLLMELGAMYLLLAIALCSDNRVVVMTRRELAALFYSPIAYIVMLGFTGVAWLFFVQFVGTVSDQSMLGRSGVVEPVIRYYMIDWFPTIICVMFAVTILTMRLLSEEHRTGTLEVLLTAPVDEMSVVLSKFFAALVFYLLLWVPWGLFLVGLRVLGGEPFDYRPMLSFYIAQVAMGSGFIAMGLFFSSLTRNQIASAILTFVGMVALIVPYFLLRSATPDSATAVFIRYSSFIELWINSLEGNLSPRHLLFHISAAIFWLFLTIKVLESRKWK